MKENISKAQQLQPRMVAFAANTIKEVNAAILPRSIVDQVTRSVASIGANYCEVQKRKSLKQSIGSSLSKRASVGYFAGSN